MEQKTYSPVSKCIYCGAGTYALNSNRRLAIEHIVPFGLSGTWELPEASCKECERVTGRIESMALNGALNGPRRFLGLKSRTKAEKAAKQLPLFVQVPGGEDQRVMVDVEDHPAWLYFPIFAEPAILSLLRGTSPPADALQGSWVKDFNFKREVLAGKYGITGSYAPPAIYLPRFARMIAKIGHAYAVAEAGLGALKWCLPEILRDPNMQADDVMPFFGTAPRQDEPTSPDILHTLRAKHTFVGEMCVNFVEVRLFACHGAPTYWVVVGTRLDDVQPAFTYQGRAAALVAKMGNPRPGRPANVFPGFHRYEVTIRRAQSVDTVAADVRSLELPTPPSSNVFFGSLSDIGNYAEAPKPLGSP